MSNSRLILHVSSTASKEDIKKSYRKLAKLYHPDKPGGCAEKFKVIKQAYDTLMGDKTPRKPKQTTDYNNRKMPQPTFIFVDVTDSGTGYLVELKLSNTVRLQLAQGEAVWDIPHDKAYATTAQPVVLKLSYEAAKRIKYEIILHLVGTDGETYVSKRPIYVPVPEKPKSKISKIFSDLW